MGYVISDGELPDGDAMEWVISNSVSELSPNTLVPVKEGREAARRWLLSHERAPTTSAGRPEEGAAIEIRDFVDDSGYEADPCRVDPDAMTATLIMRV